MKIPRGGIRLHDKTYNYVLKKRRIFAGKFDFIKWKQTHAVCFNYRTRTAKEIMKIFKWCSFEKQVGVCRQTAGRVSAISAFLGFAGCRLPVAGCWLLVTGCWLLVGGCWLPTSEHRLPPYAIQHLQSYNYAIQISEAYFSGRESLVNTGSVTKTAPRATRRFNLAIWFRVRMTRLPSAAFCLLPHATSLMPHASCLLSACWMVNGECYALAAEYIYKRQRWCLMA